MATDNMYELAFRYKDTKLWKEMFDSEIFAFRLSDGEIGYCCVMGMLGEHIALSLYIGDEGWQSFRDIAFRERDDFEPADIIDPSWMLRQVCLQCSFENKSEMEDWEAGEVRRYAKAHDIHLRGAHSYPKFTKYMRYRLPGEFETPEDGRRICEALAAAVALSELLRTKGKAGIGLFPVEEDTDTLPLLIPGEDGYKVEETNVPGEWRETYPRPAPLEEKRVEELRKLRKKGVYACEIFRLPGLVEGQLDGDEPPYFPVMLLCIDTQTGAFLSAGPVTDYDTHPESLRDAFFEALTESRQCPRAIKVRDGQARALLEDFCMSASILLSEDDDLPALDEARERVMEMLGGGDDEEEDDEDEEIDMEEVMSQAMEELMRMSDKELRSLPPEVVRQILSMANFGFVPQELQLRLRRLFKN